MYLHETEYFKDVILEVANRSGISDEIVEKDYLRQHISAFSFHPFQHCKQR